MSCCGIHPESAVEGTRLARSGNDLVAVILSSRHARDKKSDCARLRGEVLAEAAKACSTWGARTWYPNRGLAMSDFDLTFHYPPEWMLLRRVNRRQYRRQWLRRARLQQNFTRNFYAEHFYAERGG